MYVRLSSLIFRSVSLERLTHFHAGVYCWNGECVTKMSPANLALTLGRRSSDPPNESSVRPPVCFWYISASFSILLLDARLYFGVSLVHLSITQPFQHRDDRE